MRFVVTLDGEWIALFLWSSASYCLKLRDEFIGWSAPQRAQRLKLVVQNRRFVMLRSPEKERFQPRKYWAKCCENCQHIGTIVTVISPFLLKHSVTSNPEPVLATKRRTGYRWEKQRDTHVIRPDFYIPNDRPKKLWVSNSAKTPP